MVWCSHLLKNFPQFVVIHTVKSFGIVDKAEADVFLELSCLFDDLMDVNNLISDSSVFSKSSLNIWKFTVQVLLKPGLENFQHYFASMWDEFKRVVVWTFFDIAFLWDWNENFFHHSLLSGQTTGREHCPTHQQKIGLKIYWAWLHPSEQDPVSLTVSLSHQKASICLLSLSFRGKTEWKPQSQKTNQSNHMDHSLV